MTNDTPEIQICRIDGSNRSELDELIRQGARKMLQVALEAEVEEYTPGGQTTVSSVAGRARAFQRVSGQLACTLRGGILCSPR